MENNKSRKIKLTILTPQGVFFDEEVFIVTLKTPEGYIGIQRNRLPFVSNIEISSMFIKMNSDDNSEAIKSVAIGGGIVFVERDYIDIFTDDIQWKEDINKTEVQKLIEDFQIKIEQKDISAIERHKSEIVLKKASNKLATLNK